MGNGSVVMAQPERALWMMELATVGYRVRADQEVDFLLIIEKTPQCPDGTAAGESGGCT
jgi:hypothetical protein